MGHRAKGSRCGRVGGELKDRGSADGVGRDPAEPRGHGALGRRGAEEPQSRGMVGMEGILWVRAVGSQHSAVD